MISVLIALGVLSAALAAMVLFLWLRLKASLRHSATGFGRTAPASLQGEPDPVDPMRALFPGIDWNGSCLQSDNQRKINELAFKIGLVVKSGKTGLWDYNVCTDTFSYPNRNNSYFESFSWSDYLKHVHPDDRYIPDEALQKLMDGYSDLMEVSFRLQIPGSGEYRWFDLVALVYSRDKYGKPEIISGLRWDITGSVLEKQELANSKMMLNLTFSAAGIIPWEWDLATGRIGSSNASSVFYGQEYNFDAYIAAAVDPEDLPMFLAARDRMVSGEASSMDVRFRIMYKERKEWMRVIGQVVCDPQTKASKGVGVSWIITKEVEREQELAALREKAEEASRLKSAFLANMSHEIRTPLNAIVGFSNLLAESAGTDDAREFSRLISTNNELLLQLVGDILDISKIEAGQMEFNFGEVDICMLLADLEQIYALKVPEGVALVCTLPEPERMVRTERNRFVQVVSNFMNNAVKYTAAGSITLGYEEQGDMLRVYVRDTGKGIAAENLPHVFDRFAKFDPQVPGTGLGLSICDTIVRRLGGTVGVKSEPGQGSEFWFTIPA